jgi:hypothetical protein
MHILDHVVVMMLMKGKYIAVLVAVELNMNKHDIESYNRGISLQVLEAVLQILEAVFTDVAMWDYACGGIAVK